jgi:hypothetical protein
MDQAGVTVDASAQDIANLSDAAITAAVAAHAAAADPHAQYLTQVEGDGRYRQSATALSDSDIPAGIARDSEVTAAVGAHEAAADPHPGYLTLAEGNTAYEAAGAVNAHVAAADPHTQYVQPGDSPSFAGLTVTGTGPVVIPHIHGSIAGNFYVHVRNTSGGQLTAGTAVYATGSVGDTDRITVAACDPTDPLKMPAIGLLEATLANNGDGDAVRDGELRPFNTSGYSQGDQLYVGPGGVPVATAPASGLVQWVGSVARVNLNTGTILVGIGAAMARVGFTGAYADLSGKPPLGTAAATASTDYAPASQGVTGGNNHDHNGGDGAQIAYGSLSGLPTLPTGTNTGDQTLANTSDATSHTVALSASGGSLQLVEGANITLTTTGTGLDAVVTVASTAAGGISDGDKGDITVSASGATWTIDDGAVTLAKQADVATDSVFYRKTAGTGAPEVQTLATLKTDLGLSGTNSGDQDLSGKANTGAVGSTGITMSTNRLLGRLTASTGAIEEVTLGTNLSFTGTTLNAADGGINPIIAGMIF